MDPKTFSVTVGDWVLYTQTHTIQAEDEADAVRQAIELADNDTGRWETDYVSQGPTHLVNIKEGI